MKQYTRDLSNLSYTNKDFNQIYTELLDLVKKISYKWDPSESDESDPGVVLLKLAALMADKNNYNIDKNILELFPLSVTQQNAARELFDQCGYTMKYYRSADTTISLSMVQGCEPDYSDGFSDNIISELVGTNTSISNVEKITRCYVIPKYTMVSNTDNSIIYTLIEDVTLTSDGDTKDVAARQGVINTYSINGDSVITAANLDYNNRLYFTELDIAENGIFIEDSTNHNWVSVENLVLQSYGTYCYKFGLNESGTMCYIEFPEDIDSLIGQGITIRYLRTQGKEGNVAANTIKQLYTDITAQRYLDTDNVPTSECTVSTYQDSETGNVYVTNKFAATDGENPESIDSAYRNYQKIKTTFETLVSLKDYENFLYSNENVSNCFVCDRTNDPQSTYKIINSDGNNSTTVVNIAADSNNSSQPELTAFDLRVYGLQYCSNINTSSKFNKTFNVINYTNTTDTVTAWNEILLDTDGVKSLQHNYKSFKPDVPFMFMNRYPIVAKIIPTYKLEIKQQIEVQRAIINNLYTVLNARAIDFGDPIEYDLVYDTIMGSDSRIRAITLDDITYETWAQYYSSETDKIEEIRIDNLAPDLQTDDIDLIPAFLKNIRRDIYAKSVLAGKTQLLEPDDRFTYSLLHKHASLIQDAYRVTTNTKIEATCSEPLASNRQYVTQQLKTNENIIFTAPNYIEHKPYSSYVKFIHNIQLPASGRKKYDETVTDQDTIISANDIYKLKDGEYIVFFWKTEDDDYAPYQYEKYEAGSSINIISPSYRMLQQRQPGSYTTDASGNKVLTIPDIPEHTLQRLSSRGTTDAVFVSGEDQLGGLTFTQYITQLNTSDFVLSGADTITTKKPNSVLINDSTDKIFWFLNREVDGKSVLFEADSDETQYTLQDNEYFIYSNKLGTQLIMLGAGTVITRTVHDGASGKFASEWSCEVGDYDDFLAEGIEYFDNKWFKIPTNIDVRATEMMFEQFGPNNSLRFVYTGTKTSTDQPDYLLIDNSGIYGGKYKLATNETDYLLDESGNPIANGEPEKISLGDYSIYYTDADGVESSLARRSNGTTEDGIETCWQVRSILNLDASSTSSQVLDSNQQITIFTDPADVNGITLPDAAVTNVANAETGVCIYTNRDVSYTGGERIDVTSLDLVSGAIIPLQIYAYHTTAEDYASDGEWNFGVSAVQLALSEGTQEYSCEFSVPTGEYILPMTVSGDIDALSLKLQHYAASDVVESAENVVTLAGESAYQSAGKYFLRVTVKESKTDSEIGRYKLTVTATCAKDANAKLTFDNLYKYTVPNLSNETRPEYKIRDFTLSDISKLIDEQLDTTHLFDYTYQVLDEELVKNPLVASSFLDENHIYNPFTICRWDNENADLNELNVINRIK